MAKLTDKHKEERGQYFELGVHKVAIMLVEQGTTDDKKEYFDFTVVNDKDSADPIEAKVRLWFHTDAAIGYSFSIVRGIFTHNAGEAKKEAVKGMLAKVDDTDELIKLAEKHLIGKECWLEVAEDPTRTYEKDGEVKPSINRNITGYEPTPKNVSAPAAATAAPVAEASTDEDVMADF